MKSTKESTEYLPRKGNIIEMQEVLKIGTWKKSTCQYDGVIRPVAAKKSYIRKKMSNVVK
jgi:hypothetical protein